MHLRSSRIGGLPRLYYLTAAFCLVWFGANQPPGHVQAGTFTWDGGGGGNLWSDGNNWTADTAPVSSSDTLILFQNGTRLAPQLDIAQPFALNSLIFDSSAGAFALQGNVLRFQNSSSSVAPTITQNSAVAISINESLLLTNTLAIGGTGNLTLAAPVVGGGSLTKIGTGTLSLSAGNTYVGHTNVSGGTLDVTSGGALHDSLVLVNSGGTLAVDGSIDAGLAAYFQMAGTTANAATTNLNAGGTITSTESDLAIDATSNAIFNQTGGTHSVAGGLYLGIAADGKGTYNLSLGDLTTNQSIIGNFGSGVFNQTGGTHTASNGVILANSNTAANGIYTLTGGTLLTNRVVGGNSGGNSTFNFGAGTLKASANSTGFMQGLTSATVGSAGARINTNGHDITIAQNLTYIGATSSTTGSLTKVGAGTLTFSGSANFRGNTSLNEGTVAVATGGTLNVTQPPHPIFLNTFDMKGGTSLNVNGGTANLAAIVNLGIDSSSLATGINVTSGTLAAQELALATSANSSALVVQSGGIVNVTDQNNGLIDVGETATGYGSYTLSGATSQLTVRSLIVGNRGIGTFVQQNGAMNISDNYVLGASDGGKGTFELRGGSLTSTGNAIIGNAAGAAVFRQTGGTHTDAQVIISNNSGNARAAYQLDGGTLATGQIAHGTATGIGDFDFNGGILKPTANSTSFMQGLTVANVRNGGALLDTNGFDITIAQPLVHSGIGTLATGFVTGGGGYTSPPDVLVFGGGGSVLSATATIAGGQVTGVNFAEAANFTSPPVLIFNGGGGSGAFTSLFYSPDQAIDGGLTKSGAGVLTLSGPNTYTGPTTIHTGTLRTTGAGTIGSGMSALTVDIGTALDVAGTSQSVSTLSGAGTVLNSASDTAGTLTVGNGDADSSFSGLLTDHIGPSGGTLALTKVGTGTLTLTTPQSYSGSTKINGGTLALPTGSSLNGSTVEVNGGGTMDVKGGSIGPANNIYLVMGNNNSAKTSNVNLSSGTIGDIQANLANFSGTAAVFNQTGGTHSVKNALLMAIGNGSTATYNLSGAASQLSSPYTIVGYNGNGTVNQTGGSNANVGHLSVGYFANSAGTYNLSDASPLTASDGIIGESGTGTFNQTSGTVSIDSDLSLGRSLGGNGTYNLNGGTLTAGSIKGGSGTGTFNFNGGTLTPTASSSTFFSGLSAANVDAGGATINTNGYDVAIAQSLQHDANLGTLPDGGLNKLGKGMLTLTGANTFTGGITLSAGVVSAASDANLGGVSSSLNFQGGQLRYTSDVTTSRTFNLNTSTLAAGAGASITYAGATLNGGSLAGPGTHVLTNGTVITGTQVLSGVIVNQPSGTVSWNNGRFIGTLHQDTGAILNLNSGSIDTSGSLVVAGRVNVSGLESQGTITIGSGGELANSGSNLQLNGLNSRTTISAGGLLSASAGTSIELNSASLMNDGTIQGTTNINFGSVAQGAGTFGTLNLKSGGTISPGFGPGSVTVTDAFTQSSGGILYMEIGSSTGNTGYDVLNVNGTASLGGLLQVTLVNDFQPTSGQSFDILNWGSLVGNFSSINLPTLNGLTWNTSQLYTNGTLSVASSTTLAGDYNHNGVVDAADYLVWRQGLGTTYTQNDYNVWRANFGQTVGSGAGIIASTAVPEPTTLAMLIIGTLAMCSPRRTRCGINA